VIADISAPIPGLVWHDRVVGIAVRVEEYSGRIVESLIDPRDVDALCAVAAGDRAAYPLVAGVDPHCDTWFNARQSAMLAAELADLASRSTDPAVRSAAAAVLRLASLLGPAPGRPHHRKLVFIGD
jgi:hypothetical protein